MDSSATSSTPSSSLTPSNNLPGKRSRAGSRARSQKKSKSSTSPPQATKAPIRATTFGIELEFVFAFKEDLLKSVISKYDLEADIIKTLTTSEHAHLVAAEQVSAGQPVPAYDCRQRSPSWALHVPKMDLTCSSKQHKGMVSRRPKNGKLWLRRFVMEPLLIAKELLDKKELRSNVVGWIEPDPLHRNDAETASITFPATDSLDESVMLRKALVDYSKWTLTNDHTIIGARRSQLQDHLRMKEVSEEEFASWDSYGIEMISPVFELGKKREAFTEVGKYLDTLAGEDTSAFGTVWTSAHVHVGFNFDEPEDMPILLLQHLAHILVLHEDLITKCHPRSRSGVLVPEKAFEESTYEDIDDEEFDPNAEYTRLPSPTEEELEREHEEAILAVETAYTGVHPGAENVLSNARYLREQFSSQSPNRQELAMRDAIFQQDGTISDLVSVLQHSDDQGNLYRGYMYNFANLDNLARNQTRWKPIKPTVEFRQHACTVDPVVLEHWVMLLEAIVRKAEETASETIEGDDMEATYAEREVSKYPSSGVEQPWAYQDMRLFCVEFLGLSEEEGDYWQGRFDQYKDDRPEDVSTGSKDGAEVLR